jgi:hypothetical protein
MKQRERWLILVLFIIACLSLSACAGGAKTEAAAEEAPPVVLEPIDGTDLNRVILSERAAERLGIETVQVQEMVIPYAAVIYDVNGGTWLYTNPESLVYVRHPIVIDRVDGDQAVLLEGPPVGTAIVTVGVPELYGADTGVGK